MKQAPTAYTLARIAKIIDGPHQMSRDGRTWHPARPEGFHSIGNRLRLAWEVFTGRADVLRWPGGQ